jgi:acetylornithine deacetylase/succinyl-diaminopimelate desuccinylase-like protein
VAHVLPDVKGELVFLAAYQKEPLAGAMRRAAASAPKLSAADERVLAGNAETNAMIRTTCVTTMLQGSPQDNVLPTTATATVNCRILPDETSEGTRAWLEKVVGDRRVTVEYLVPDDHHDGAGSPIYEHVMGAVRAAAQARWPGSGAFATMLPGASDSRFLRGAGIAAYGIDTTPTSMAEDAAGHTAHGPDERVPLRWLDDGVRFLRDVVVTLAQ